MDRFTPPKAETTMSPELALYLEALMALTREPDRSRPPEPRRRPSAQASLFDSPLPGDGPALSGHGSVSVARRVELAEVPGIVRESRAFRLVNWPDPRLAWLLRYAVGCALANACDPATPREFPLRAATRALGEQLGAPIQLVCGLEPLLDSGPLTRTEEGGLMLLPGLEYWLLGRDISDPDIFALHPEPELARLAVIQAASVRLAAVLDPARPVVLRCPDPSIAVALAGCVSAGRSRLLQAWADRGDRVPSPALRCTAEAMGEDLMLVLNHSRTIRSPFASSEFSLEFTAGQGLLFLVLDDENSAGHPLLGLGSMVDLVDLEPLCMAVAELRITSGQQSVAAPATEALRSDRIQALHQALYPDTPPRTVIQTAAPRSECLDDESATHLSTEHWLQPTRTLDALVLPEPIRAALGAIVRAAEPGRRVVVLFHGPPGTGKSEAGHCLAGSMGRPIYRLDGGVMRGRFYGQFERRLNAVFAEAQQRNAVILIDEADEWVGRREGSAAQVGGAHILESSQILQALERYQGVAVLTTNRSEMLDPALSRRVDAWIHLPLPAMEERMALWVLALGDAPPLRPVDLMLLTAIPLSGGEIAACVREVTVTGGSLTTPALLAAARRRSERRALVGD